MQRDIEINDFLKEKIMSDFGNKPADSKLESLGYIACTLYKFGIDYDTHEPDDGDLVFIHYKSIKAFYLEKDSSYTVIDVGTGMDNDYNVLDTPVEIANKIAVCKDAEEWKLGK